MLTITKTSRLLVLVLLLHFLIIAATHGQEKDSTIMASAPEVKHSPRVAGLMSTVLPGSGQIYNKKYWKAPIIWGGLATSIYFIVLNQTNFNIYNNAYNSILQGDTTAVVSSLDKLKGESGEVLVDTYEPQLKEFLINGKEYYQRYMNLSYIATGLIYFLNIIDAMVDAYLFDYDVSDKITMHVEPKVLGRTHYHTNVVGFKCSLTFY